MYYQRLDDTTGEVVPGKVRKPWARERLITKVEGESLTVQDPGQDTDINHIVARFDRTGVLPSPKVEAQYGDVTALQGDPLQLMEKAREIDGKVEAAKVELAERAKAKQDQEAADAKKSSDEPKSPPAKEPDGSK